MIFIITLLAILTFGGIALVILDHHFGWSNMDGFMIAGGIIAAFAGIVLLIICGVAIGAKHKAEMLNEAFGTSYTTEQVFFAPDVINHVIQGTRERIDGNFNVNINGSLEDLE